MQTSCDTVVIAVNLNFHILPLPPHSILQTQTILGVSRHWPNYGFEKFAPPRWLFLSWMETSSKGLNSLSWSMKKIFYFLHMTKDLGECGRLVEITLGSFSVVPLVEIMMGSGGSGKCSRKGEAVFSRVCMPTTNKTYFVFAVGVRFGPNPASVSIMSTCQIRSTSVPL